MLRTRLVFTVLTLSLFLTFAARADIIVTNLDTYERTLQITEGSDKQVIYDLLIGTIETIDGVCNSACSIKLDNGNEGSFPGFGQVHIFKGIFTWSP